MKEWEESIKKYQTPGWILINRSMSVIIYSEYCEVLEEENILLKEEVLFLRQQLEFKTMGLPVEDINTEE